MFLILNHFPPLECLVSVKPWGREWCADNLSPLPGGQQGRVRPLDARTEVWRQRQWPVLPGWNLWTNNRTVDWCRRYGHCVLAPPAWREIPILTESGVDCFRDGPSEQRTGQCGETKTKSFSSAHWSVPSVRDGASLLEKAYSSGT